MHAAGYRIANIGLDLTSPWPLAELGLAVRLGPFAEREDAPPALVRVRVSWEPADGAPPVEGELVYDPGFIWKMYRAGALWHAAFLYPDEPPAGWEEDPAYAWARQQRVDVQGVLTAPSSWDQVTLRERPRPAPWQSLLTVGGIELAVRANTVLAGGLIFHASGVDDHGRGRLFVGHSGVGKSTQLGFWLAETGVALLAEDRVAVQLGAGAARAYGTPWGGRPGMGLPADAPLAGIYLLEQATDSAVVRLSPAEAGAQLAKHAFLPYWDPALMLRALANLDTLVNQVPIYRLRARKSPETVALVRAHA